MILVRVDIENYKQYTGERTIEIPDDAMVGVIGENGAGKTTLFEAIEWCLYSPRSIGQNDVRPRAYTGHTTVRVHLETADRRERYIVERVLKRTPSATIYRVDETGEYTKVVEGPRQVTDYVAGKLIGLPHTAFTATFFTRQKELHLFGSETPARRREAIGRMLGLETIRNARRGILDDRTHALNEARAMRTQYERESAGRDFAAELEAATATIDGCTATLATSTGTIGTTEGERDQAQAATQRALERREADTALEQELRQRERDRQAREERVGQICHDLQAIARREEERARLAPLAAQAGELAAEVARGERERTRYERRVELERSLREIEKRRRDTCRTMSATVTGVTITRSIHTGWTWGDDDDARPLDGVTRLVGLLDSLDLSAAERKEQDLATCVDAAATVAEAKATLQRYVDLRKGVDREEQDLLAHGEPRDRLPALDRDRERLFERQTVMGANRTNLEQERDKARTLLRNLQDRQFGDDCPTCGRPFSDGDAVVVIAAMQQRIESHDAEIRRLAGEGAAVTARIAALDEERKRVHEAQAKLDQVRGRIQKSVAVIEAQQERVAAAEAALRAALEALGSERPPSPEQVRRARVHTREIRSLSMTRKSITTCSDAFTRLDRDSAVAQAEMSALGDIAFDPAAHERARQAFHEADGARIAISHIDRELSRRPTLQQELVTHQERLAAIGTELQALAAQRKDLGYDPAELPAAQARLAHAQQAVQAAHTAYHQARTTLREAEIHREGIQREQERLRVLARAADGKQVEADELDLMAREFTGFERFAFNRKKPILEQETSRLVDDITGGKYQRVEFDDDFGIMVFDGEESESGYPVETFSGGERDAIVLAARLALSQLIGRQANNPPGFLVLDEVFGSLDTERRAQLLNVLQSLSAMMDHVRQLFIISHVEDVRSSPVLDEVWRVEETADGSSQITSLQPGVEIDAP